MRSSYPVIFLLFFLLPCTASQSGCSAALGIGLKKYKIHSDYGVNDPHFSHTIQNLLGHPFLDGNRVTTHLNGDEIFPPMLDAIHAAKKTITFETYIYWSGDIGKRFTDALSERARNGVRVLVVLDAFGCSRIDRGYIQEMRDAGVEVKLYHKLRWYHLGSAVKFNNRTHRKLLVVDGEIAFTGGVGIADMWLGRAQDSGHWRDNHYRVTGPVVSQFQAAFADNWMEITGEVLQTEEFFPLTLYPTGSQTAELFMSSPEGGSRSMQLLFLLSIAAAKHSVRIATPYFVPDELTRRTLIEAAHRGARVQIIVPGTKIDQQIVHHASVSHWGELLRAGIEIYVYEPTMYHVKMLILDEHFASIGSANMDNRSFRLNDEANINILDSGFAAEQAQIFDRDLQHCHRMDYEQWRQRPLLKKWMQKGASLFSDQM